MKSFKKPLLKKQVCFHVLVSGTVKTDGVGLIYFSIISQPEKIIDPWNHQFTFDDEIGIVEDMIEFP